VDSTADAALKILLSEKEYADKQIADNFGTNVKIVGTVFTFVTTAVGWLFAKDTGLAHFQTALILLALVAIGSVGLIMGALFNGFAFGYIAYKSGLLGPRLRELTALSYNPLQATGFIETTPARKLIVFSTTYLALGQLILSAGTFVAGTLLLWREVARDAADHNLLWFVPIAALMLVGATTSAYLTVKTVNHLRSTYPYRNGVSANPAPAADG
jgi:hypothetical protein